MAGRSRCGGYERMRITIEPTPQFFMAGDVMVRLWQGVAEDGTLVVALVSMVGSAGDVTSGLFGSLVSIPPPDTAEMRQWAHHILGQAPLP